MSVRLFGPKDRHGLVIVSTSLGVCFCFSPLQTLLFAHSFSPSSPPTRCALRHPLFQPRSLLTDRPATMQRTLAPAHHCPPSSRPRAPPADATVTPLRQSSSLACRPSTSSLPRSHKRVKSARQSFGNRAKREASIPMVRVCFDLLLSISR